MDNWACSIIHGWTSVQLQQNVHVWLWKSVITLLGIQFANLSIFSSEAIAVLLSH